MIGLLQRLERAGAWLEDALLVILLLGMIALATGQIIGRNLFSITFLLGDELLRIMVLWLTLVGAVAASRTDRHINIAVLDKILPPRLFALSGVVTHLFTATICALLAWHSFRFMATSREFGDTLLGDVPAWALQAVLPLGFALMAYRHFVNAAGSLRTARRTEPPP